MVLGWLFFKVIFAEMVDSQIAGEYIAGMILPGVAPCTAMVFVWGQLTACSVL
jgi:ACR3 family arsenite transporter